MSRDRYYCDIRASNIAKQQYYVATLDRNVATFDLYVSREGIGYKQQKCENRVTKMNARHGVGVSAPNLCARANTRTCRTARAETPRYDRSSVYRNVDSRP